ncbi:PTS system galactitol-specific family transporter subunit IIC [Streptococcus pneumoniae]|nr:PTS system galactitol-specific family transporter subunit IIC [Streptococcus pneumoniae]
MDAIFDLIGKVFNPILEMGGPVIMLIILTVLALLFGVKFSKALEGGIKLAIALTGIGKFKSNKYSGSVDGLFHRKWTS